MGAASCVMFQSIYSSPQHKSEGYLERSYPEGETDHISLEDWKSENCPLLVWLWWCWQKPWCCQRSSNHFFPPILTSCLKRLSVPCWIGFKPQGSSQISAFIPKQRIRCWKEVCSAPEYQIFKLSNYLWIEQLCKSTVVQFFHLIKLLNLLKVLLTSQKNIYESRSEAGQRDVKIWKILCNIE